MSVLFEGEEFVNWHDRNSGRTYSDAEFRRCLFKSSSLSITRNPKQRSTVRNIRIIECEEQGCSLRAAVVEDVIVDGLSTNGLLQAWGAVFRHVTLRGKIGRIMFSPLIAPGRATEKEQRRFQEANASYYSGVDWALDISEGLFQECEIQGIPVNLIRRDPATQVVVLRERILQADWRQLKLGGTYWPVAIELFLERGEPGMVLVAPKRDLRIGSYMEAITELRDAGLVEQD